MALFDWLRRSQKKNNEKENVNSLINEQVQAEEGESIGIDDSEYDNTDMMSTFSYVLSKYGKKIVETPDRLKNILADMAPSLTSERKLLIILCKCGEIKKVISSDKWDQSEKLLWVENASNYLVSKELIDKVVAYSFCRQLICELSGEEIPDLFLKKYEEENRIKSEEERKKEAAHARAVKAAETRKRNAELAKEREIDELKRKLEESEKARAEAEVKAINESNARKKEQKDAAAKLEEEVRKRKQVDKLNQQLLANQNYTESIGVDYSEIATARVLFEKYNGRIDGNVIVQALNWTGDYCFVIDEIVRKNGIIARGTVYYEGEFSKNYSYDAGQDGYLFKMYNGPSRDIINEIHERRSKDPYATTIAEAKYRKSSTNRKNSDVLVMPGNEEYTSIEKIKAANPGKRIIVVKDTWENDYCFCVEDFEGTVKAVGTRFLDGNPRGSEGDWVDRRHRKFKVYNGPSKKKIEEYYKKRRK